MVVERLELLVAFLSEPLRSFVVVVVVVVVAAGALDSTLGFE